MIGIETFDQQGNMTFGSGDTTLKYIGTLSTVFPMNIYPGHTIDIPMTGVTNNSLLNEITGGVTFGQISVAPFNGFVRAINLIERYNITTTIIIKVYQI